MFAKVPGIWILLCMIQISNLTTNIHQSKMVYGHGHFFRVTFSLIKPPGGLVPFWNFTPLAAHPSTSPLGRGMGWLQLRKGPLALGGQSTLLKLFPPGKDHDISHRKGKDGNSSTQKGWDRGYVFFSTGGNYCNSSFAPAQELQLPKGN